MNEAPDDLLALVEELSQPAKASEAAPEALSNATIVQHLEALFTATHPLAQPLAPYAKALTRHAAELPLHQVISLLLGSVKVNKPLVFEHALCGMAMAGAIAMDVKADLSLCMLGGLLHDIGEIYTDTQPANKSTTWDLAAYKNVQVHPRVGYMLLTKLTDYPQSLARAVGEHHERLNGSGYPAHLEGSSISQMGRVLAVVEACLGIFSRKEAPLSRASLALRVVPYEFDAHAAHFIFQAAAQSGESLAQAQPSSLAELMERGTQLRLKLENAMAQAQILIAAPLQSQDMKTFCARIHRNLLGVARGWNAAGLWELERNIASLDSASHFEIELAQNELSYRLQTIARECLLLGAQLPVQDEARLALLSRILT